MLSNLVTRIFLYIFSLKPPLTDEINLPHAAQKDENKLYIKLPFNLRRIRYSELLSIHNN